jgi:hypothetical protein
MCNEAAAAVDRVLPNVPIRQWVLSLPFELRRLAAFNAKVLTALGRLFVEATAKRLWTPYPPVHPQFSAFSSINMLPNLAESVRSMFARGRIAASTQIRTMKRTTPIEARPLRNVCVIGALFSLGVAALVGACSSSQQLVCPPCDCTWSTEYCLFLAADGPEQGCASLATAECATTPTCECLLAHGASTCTLKEGQISAEQDVGTIDPTTLAPCQYK